MRRLAATLVALLLIVSASTPAFGWGDKGHKTIGQIAQLRLANTNTLTRIKNILRPGETLSSVAIWADRVKDEDNFSTTAVNPDSDTQNFFRNLANRRNRKWHFVNLALHCTSYNDVTCKPFTASNDIVQMINLSIRKLQGGSVPQLTRRNALRLLVHLVGDLHQPLHVGVGYINVDDDHNQILIEREPMRVRQNDFPSDGGGNDLLIAGEESDNLHSFWDGDLVDEADGDQSIVQFATLLNSLIPPAPSWNTQGNVSTWAAQWASDTLQVSNERAYDSTVRIKKVVVIDDRPKYRTTLGTNYTAQNIPVVKLQLEKGGYRLAKLLQTILP
jgi:hypothetical protein